MSSPTKYYERDLEKTSTWAVAVVCFVILAISIFVEHVIHLVEKFLKKKRRPALVEALEKVKSELMLLGFISLLLTVFQSTIAGICISKDVASTWHPCTDGKTDTEVYGGKESPSRRLLEFDDFDFESIPRRSLATKGYDKCTKEDKVAFVTAYGIHQLHVFIFVLALFHVLYCILTLALGTIKMKKWKLWEDETKTLQYQYHNDPERFRFARETSFGRRHLNFWSRSPITLWIVCFFRQFFGTVTKVDYFALRHGFIMAHLTAESETTFDFQKYIHRSLEEDFKEVVGISPVIWFSAVAFLLTNTNGWYSYYWLPFIPLIIILMVGTKLQVIITKMGLRIQERGDVVKGTPVVQPGDELFWFGRPRFILFLINFVLFLNAFQLAFFAWSTYEWGLNNCFHHKTQDIVIRISMGVIIQILCSYVTLPLYALVTQMGSNMKPTVFNEGVATALKHWHHSARKHTRHGTHSASATTFSSRQATPEHGTSPMHLLHNHQNRSVDSLHASPGASDVEDEQWANPDYRNVDGDDSHYRRHQDSSREGQGAAVQLTTITQAPEEPPTQHEIDITPSAFSFRRHS